jgi:pimeloyl-ACP methyl ester carboxylesterase
LLSHLVETLRRAPAAAGRLSWAPDVPVAFLDLNGFRVRYVDTGRGRPLVLLHTLRTQLDMFHEMIPELSRHFRVLALDYPGHGYSDIPDVEYSAEFFVGSVARFLERLDIEDAIVVGESIGGSIALLLAAQGNPRVRRVIAVNPYDYDRGRGLRRSSLTARLLFTLAGVPVVGGTVMRFRNFPIEKKVFEGGVSRADVLPPTLLREMYGVGNRRGHYRAFMSLLRLAPGWDRARAEYARIRIPVLLIYGTDDWSRPEEREATLQAIPRARMRVVGGRHFLSLEAPEELLGAVLAFSGLKESPDSVSGPTA